MSIPYLTNTADQVSTSTGTSEIRLQNIGDSSPWNPDDWVVRDPRLVKLTADCPFNAEAQLKDLFASGTDTFLTPNELFYVRSRGAVPKVKDAPKWQLEIGPKELCDGDVTSLTLEKLQETLASKIVTIPVTLACAGLRRKEQNIVRKAAGFSFGAAAISTATFTGVYLADVFEQIIKPKENAKHVIFEGKDVLPIPDSKEHTGYNTSQPLIWARDKGRGMMLAWKMNGEDLNPDHGYPLRLVVPSQIGGRSVKWLCKIQLSETESSNHYHLHDNKLLPTQVTPDIAHDHTKEWWTDPRYIIRDHVINSVIFCPDHNEFLDTTVADKQPNAKYTLKGYAYAGGGRRVTRVEISADHGDSWSLAKIKYPEDSHLSRSINEFDTCFCWCFWSFEIPISVLQTSQSIIVRSMDQSLAIQPRDIYWNATGMMTDWWFRVFIHKVDNGLRFEHPMVAGTQAGGWMQRLQDQDLDPSKPEVLTYKRKPDEVSMINPDSKQIRSISHEEFKNNVKNNWFLVHKQVYDPNIDSVLSWHPGTADAIKGQAGKEAAGFVMDIHDSDARKSIAQCHIGYLVEL